MADSKDYMIKELERQRDRAHMECAQLQGVIGPMGELMESMKVKMAEMQTLIDDQKTQIVGLTTPATPQTETPAEKD